MKWILRKNKNSDSIVILEKMAGEQDRVVLLLEAGFSYPKVPVTISEQGVPSQTITESTIKVESFQSFPNVDFLSKVKEKYKLEMSCIFRELNRCFFGMEKESFCKVKFRVSFDKEDCDGLDLKSQLEVQDLLKL